MEEKKRFLIHFDLAFKSKTKAEFEQWFCRMAQKVYGDDFEQIKPGGRQGDKKCDGRLIASETVFQCFAPESPARFAKEGPKKVRDSFPEILEYWPNLRKWVFLHNNEDGVPPAVSDALEALRKEYKSIEIATASREFLKDKLHDRLCLAQLGDIYPDANLNFSSVQMKDIRPLLRSIRTRRSLSMSLLEFGEIPNEDKLEINDLSSDAKIAIKRAYTHIRLVVDYFGSLSNPANANNIQGAMRDEYLRLKDLRHTADEILANLLKFVGDDGSEPVRAAAYVIVAYYFDSCDIFENDLVMA